jgi:anti-sigma B factor antagonist
VSDQQPFELTDADAATVARPTEPELTSGGVESLLECLTARMDGGQPVQLVMDLSGVKFINSVSMGAMVVLLRRIKSRGGRLALAGLSGHCLNVMKVTGLDRVFEMHETVDAALAAFDHRS